MRKGLLAITSVVAIAVGIGVAVGFGGPILDRFAGEETEGQDDAAPQAQPVQTAVSQRRDVVERFSAVGTTRAVQSVDILPRTAGVVTAFDIPSGKRVEAGYELVQLDDRAERAALRQVQARLGEAQATANRTRQLVDRDVTADASLEAAQAALGQAQAEADAARVAVEDRKIVAPFSGTLGLTELDIGQRLEPTNVITTLDDLSQIDILFTLPETLFNEVRSGQELRATGSGSNRTFEGEISTVGTRIDPGARFFEVRGRFDNAEGALTTGMLMNVELTLETRNSVTVPELAIVNVGQNAFVFVPEDGQAKERKVEVGLLQEGQIEILAGLDDGETVITTGLQGIADGDPVELQEAAARDEPAAAEPDQNADRVTQ